MANIANIITYTTCVRQRLFPKGKQRATAVQPSAMVKAVAIAAVPPSTPLFLAPFASTSQPQSQPRNR